MGKYSIQKLVSAVLCLLVCFVGVFDRDLWTPDEPRVAAMALEMAETGNFIVPHLAGEPFVEKPPLYYFTGALTIRASNGIEDVAGTVRLSTVIWGLGVLLMTWLTGRRLFGGATGYLSVLVLATMSGFVENFHWIRVDAALAFFVMAAVWAVTESVPGRRPYMLVLAGFFSAGAFLSKGFIGPVLIVIPVAGIIAGYLLVTPRRPVTRPLLLAALGGLALFAAVSGAWVLLFRNAVSPDTWHEWFWVNHFGRFSGEAVRKGHMHAGKPLYYIKTMMVYSLPWSPLVIAWLVRTGRNFKSMSSSAKKSAVFLLVWGLGSLTLLTLPSTKRDVYFLPVLPAFAVMTAAYCHTAAAKWVRGYTWSIIGLSALCTAVFMAAPWGIAPFSTKIPDAIRESLGTWGWRNASCLVLLILIVRVAVQFKRGVLTPVFSLFLCSAMLYTGAYQVPLHAIDHDKSLRPEIMAFVARIPSGERARVAGWNFNQTNLGSFYVYTGWMVPQITSRDRLNAIMMGTDPEFTSVILNEVDSIPELITAPHDVLVAAYPRGVKNRRGLFWIRGTIPSAAFSY